MVRFTYLPKLLKIGGVLLMLSPFFAGITIATSMVDAFIGLQDPARTDVVGLDTNVRVLMIGVFLVFPGAFMVVMGNMWQRSQLQEAGVNPAPRQDDRRMSRLGPKVLIGLGLLPLILQAFDWFFAVHHTLIIRPADMPFWEQVQAEYSKMPQGSGMSLPDVIFIAIGVFWWWTIWRRETRGYLFSSPDNAGAARWEKRIAKTVFVLVGALSVLAAVFGMFYNISPLLFNDLSQLQNDRAPYVMHFYLVYSGLFILCYVALLVCGVQFVRFRTRVAPYFALLMACEVVCFFSLAAFWLVPSLGMSAGGATGIAGGGLMAQWIILFPIWAPFLAWWAAGVLRRPGAGPGEDGPARAVNDSAGAVPV